MNLTQTLFSFNGRIRRSTFWLYGLGLGVVLGVVISVGIMLSSNGGAMAMVGMVLAFAAYIVAIWCGLALQVKRWHDRDKSWVWVFIAFIPFIGAIWSLVETGFLDGTQGPNKYGPSPKGITGPAPVAT
jgi:uncharacterized membrane protein YhaH (DUF805 family)